MGVLIKFLGELILKGGEPVNLVVFVPRITIPLRVEIRMRMALLHPDAIEEVLVVLNRVFAKLLQCFESLEALTERLDEIFRDTLSTLYSLVVGCKCIPPLIDIVLPLSIDHIV